MPQLCPYATICPIYQAMAISLREELSKSGKGWVIAFEEESYSCLALKRYGDGKGKCSHITSLNMLNDLTKKLV